MAINAQLANRRNNSRQRVRQQAPEIIEETPNRSQLVQAARDLGGNSKPAFVSNATIPTLQREVINSYEQNKPKPSLGRFTGAMMGAVLQNPNSQTAQAARTNNANYAAAQRNNQLYNTLKTDEVEQTLARLGQTDIARKPNEQFVESIKSHGGSINPFDYENFWDFQAHSPIGGAALLDVLGVESHKFERQNLTPEMARAGLTERDLEVWNNTRNAEERQRVLSQWAKEHPVISTLRGLPEQLNESIENVANNLGSYVTGTPMESRPTRADIYRNAVSENIDSNVGRMAYGAVNSIGDMALATLTGNPVAAAAVMGAEKASNVMNDAIDRSLTPNQIMAEGILSGVSTALTEAIPMGGFIKGGESVLKGIISEGLQEGSESILDTIFDEAVTRVGGNADRSSLHMVYDSYINAGYEPDQALAETLKGFGREVAVESILGGITGGLMQGGSNAIRGRDIFSGNLNQTAQNQILNDVKAQSADVANNLTAETYNDFTQNIETLKENAPELTKRLDEVQTNLNNTILGEIKNASDVILTYPENDITNNFAPSMEAYNNFIQTTEQIKEQIPTLAKDIDTIVNNFSNEFTVLTSENERTNVKTNVDNVIPRVDNVNANVDTPVNTQPVQNEIPILPREPRASRADVSTAINTANGIRENLGLFKEKNARTLEARIDKAIQNVRNTTGQAQIDAIQELNNTLDGVRNAMQYSTIGINERGLNADGFERMHGVTDGRRIRVTPAMLNDLNISLTQLNSMTNTGTNNRIRFYAADNPNAVSLDSVWNEMVEMSGNELPMVSEGDQLQALINYINEYKSKKGNEVNTVSFNDLPVTDSRPEVVREWEGKADDLIDRMLEGDYTEEEVQTFLDDILEAGSKSKKNSEAQQALADLWVAVKYAERVKPQSTIKLDDDIKAIETPEQAQQTLEEAINGLAMNLGFFGGETDSDVDTENLGRVETGRKKTSEVFTNTAENSGILSDKQKAMHEEDGSMLYDQNSERESVEEATNRLTSRGFVGEYERLLNKEGFNNVDTDEMMMIWKHYNDQAIDLDNRGLDSTSAWKKAYECLNKIKAEGSREGSALQALAKWSRNNTPEGLLAQATSIITAAQNGYSGYSKTDQGWFKQIAKETKGKTKEMDVAFIKDFITEARKLEGLDINSQQAKHIMANLGTMVNSQIPVTLREKITTILMDNMLGNFRTLITRNAGGNIAFNMIEQKLRKPLSAFIDSRISAKKGTARTISENTTEGRSAYREGFKEALKQEMYDFANNIQSARSGENTLATAVTNNRQVFKNTNIFGKVGNFYNKLVKAGLSAGDRPFYEGVYHQYMTEFQKMYDDGRLGDMKESDFKKLAEANAQLRALEAVYQDDSAMSQAFMKMKEGVNNLSQGIVGADLLSQFTMPFVKTPANIIQRAIEYSPIGIVKNAIQTVREVNHAMTDHGMMDFNQERFATETARNLIGSVLFTAAVMLAKSGAMTGAYSEDKDMAQAQREAGMQEYALHNPLGFNGDVSVDWIPVLGNDMVAAASAYDAFKNNPELNTAQRIGRGLTAGLKSQFESSMLQGLQRLVGGSGSFGSDGDILTNAIDTLKSGATQFIPSLLRQGAAVADPYRRQLSGANPDDYYVNAVLNAIPGLRQTLEPRVSRTGENLEQNAGRDLGWKIFDNFINPATVTVGTPDNVRDEAMRLFESTNSNRAFEPTVTISELKVDDHVPTAEEYTEYQRNAYGAMNEVASQVIGSEYYNGLSDDDKVSMLADIYSAIKTVEKKNVLGLDTSGLTGAEKAYHENGVDGLIDYMTVRSVLSQMGMQNNATNREQVLNTLNQGGVNAVNQMIEESQELQDAGLSTNMQFKYEHATNYIPSLTPTQFADTWNAINADGNTTIKQQEIIDYLNQNPQSHTEDAMLYWQAYGSSDWASIPVLSENGVWEAKRP